jgi:two-component system chemotaxis family response regulator WspR
MALRLNAIIIDDDAADRKILQITLGKLEQYEFDFKCFSTGDEALKELPETEADIIFLDYMLPAETGLSVLKKLRHEGDERPVIVMTGTGNERLAAEITREGADDYLVKGSLDNELLSRAIHQALDRHKLKLENKKLYKELERMAYYDQLTGALNRAAMEKRLNEEWMRAMRDQVYLSCIMIDIDHFKSYNDHYGHIAGDSCLSQVAALIIETAQRAGDIVCRFGGEEFLVLLPGTDIEGALFLSEKIRNSILQAEIPHEYSPVQPFVTISCGVSAGVPERGRSSEPYGLIAMADEALYSSKERGRNRSFIRESNPNNAEW